jgi:putative ABC transport system ATP-binding protein
MKSPPIIVLKNVSKTYYLGEEKVPALKDINLEIASKEYVGILGSSGCGKSTLMHIIGLLETPSTGTIKLDKKNIHNLSDQELSRMRNRYVGFVFQSFNLINKFTVMENILLPAKYSKTKLDFDPKKRATDLMEKFGIIERQHFFPNKISGGQQQRVAIARALIMNPKIILADEPTGNLDSKTGDEILDILEELNKDFDTTVIVVTHEYDVAKRTRRQIYMRDGSIVKKGGS